jgi:hypothetical protein
VSNEVIILTPRRPSTLFHEWVKCQNHKDTFTNAAEAIIKIHHHHRFPSAGGSSILAVSQTKRKTPPTSKRFS